MNTIIFNKFDTFQNRWFSNPIIKFIMSAARAFMQIPIIGIALAFLRNLLLPIDHGWNALSGMDPRETASSSMGKLLLHARNQGRFVLTLEVAEIFLSIILFDKFHCRTSIETNYGINTPDYRGLFDQDKVMAKRFARYIPLVILAAYWYYLDIINWIVSTINVVI